MAGYGYLALDSVCIRRQVIIYSIRHTSSWVVIYMYLSISLTVDISSAEPLYAFCALEEGPEV